MARVLIPLAHGCEELEAVTLIDLLRRAGIEVVVAGLAEGPVKASRGTVLVPDTTLEAVLQEDFDMMVLPGGLPGADHLEAFPRVDILSAPVVTDGKVITSRGPGTAMDFALILIEILSGRPKRLEVEAALVRESA